MHGSVEIRKFWSSIHAKKKIDLLNTVIIPYQIELRARSIIFAETKWGSTSSKAKRRLDEMDGYCSNMLSRSALRLDQVMI